MNATLAPFAPIPEAVQLQLGNVSTTDGDCSSYCEPNEFSQRRRCLSCEVQMDQPSTSREGPAIKVETEAHITEHSCLLCLTSPWCPDMISILASDSCAAFESQIGHFQRICSPCAMNRKDLFGCFVVEQADVDPREIEVVEATARNEFIIVHQPNLSTSSLYQTYKNTNAFLASARVLVRIALHKCSRKVLTVLMFCERGTAGWHQSRGCG